MLIVTSGDGVIGTSDDHADSYDTSVASDDTTTNDGEGGVAD